MSPTQKDSFRLFSIWGIDVYLHWSWFLVAAIELEYRKGIYSAPIWNAYEYLSLFLIVLMHEFGHALACRQVGGRADKIVLWPLGGVAYVAPPQRPGATLWSIAAGPLVNVALIPVLWLLSRTLHGIDAVPPNVLRLVGNVLRINTGLLVFNILPIYPLDGGQILRSVMWFGLGRARSLQVAAVIGFIGVAAFAVFALLQQSIWMGVMTAFIFMNCRRGWLQSRALLKLAALPRRSGFACPSCRTSPPVGEFWRCANCQNAFDPFLTQATCPHCSTRFPLTQCLDCGVSRPYPEWVREV